MRKTKIYRPFPCFANNERKMHGLPLHRKGKGKRFLTRHLAMEVFAEFIDYCDQR